MSVKQAIQERIEKMSQADLEWLDQMLKQHRRENLKRLARELADSTEEERTAFAQSLERRPWSSRADS
jgi:hypothetical protein